MRHYRKIISVFAGILLTGAIIFACDNNDSSPTPMEWVGYYTTLGANNTPICAFEVIEEVTLNERNILATSIYIDDSGVRHHFRQVGYIGSNQQDSSGNPGKNSMVMFYQTSDKSRLGEFINPGIYNLVQNNTNEKEWRGFWLGRPNAPENADIIKCPYVLVQEASDSANLPIPVLDDDGIQLNALNMADCTGVWSFFSPTSNPCIKIDVDTGQLGSPIQ